MLEYILSILNDAVLVYNLDKYEFMFISPAVLQLTGYNREDFFQRHQLLEEMIHPEDRPTVFAQIAQIALPGEAELSYRIITPGQEIKYIQEKRVLLNHTETNDQLSISILRDITEAVLYKTDAEHKMWFLSALINSIGVLIFRTGADGRYVFVNDIYTRLLGYTRDELIGRHISSIVHPDDVEKVNQTFHECFLHPGEVFHIKHRKVTASGEVRWLLTDATAVKNEQGETVEIQGAGMDITEQQAAEQEIAWTKNSLEALMNNTRDLIWSIDIDRKYVFVNAALKDWVAQRYQIDLKEGRPAMEERYPPSMVESWRSYYDKALSGDTFSVNYEDVSPLVDNPVTLEVSFNPIRNTSLGIIGVGCFAHDISESLRAAGAILQQNERLKQIASISSHELRRPVATLIGLISILDRQDPANPENSLIHEHMEKVGQELDEVIRLIVDKTFR